MLIELIATLVIQTSKIGEINVSNNDNNLVNSDTGSDYFTLGDSQFQLEQKERELADEVSRRNRQVIARERATRTSGTSSTGTGGIATKLYQDYTNNCVAFAKAQTGINHPIGAGGRASIQGQEPKVGAIAVEKGRAHASVVTNIEGNLITIKESNYIKGWITTRTIARSSFLGYIYR